MSGSFPTQPSNHDESFESLLVSHQKRIYFFIRSMVFNPEDARDVLQDVNSIILRKRDRFAQDTDFKSWAFAIARFECFTYLRKYQSGKLLAAGNELAEFLADTAEDHADRFERWMRALEQCRKHLPTESNDLLNLRYGTRRPLEEIAHAWKSTEGALKQKLFRARAQLKDCILKRLGEFASDDSARDQ
ncbi:sigma-70 family RNA polymerase sigma factor [Luteolibacter pohnpeiensis]|uniref:Sigma-70 family RNA polymerase sigma factor n=1 Tax=Luteolibacter pohnpeiensis TaxID=454153 RepID=A0A934VYI0_9BACT|nr:sigma-70 family RNA polymerase sigma factor [Luteolibacter pohnpeiensis]MBK1884539.1 sigma-70 family RNA polymerase sigma factor [Luteolibacter pohnpeiensis]